jgi:hypothetical protein
MMKVVVESSTTLRFARVERGVTEVVLEEGDFTSREPLVRFPSTAILDIIAEKGSLLLFEEDKRVVRRKVRGSSYHLKVMGAKAQNAGANRADAFSRMRRVLAWKARPE